MRPFSCVKEQNTRITFVTMRCLLRAVCRCCPCSALLICAHIARRRLFFLSSFITRQLCCARKKNTLQNPTSTSLQSVHVTARSYHVTHHADFLVSRDLCFFENWVVLFALVWLDPWLLLFPAENENETASSQFVYKPCHIQSKRGYCPLHNQHFRLFRAT